VDRWACHASVQKEFKWTYHAAVQKQQKWTNRHVSYLCISSRNGKEIFLVLKKNLTPW